MQLSRYIFIVFGIVAPIMIGALHISVHFSELLTPEIKAILDVNARPGDDSASLWNTWGIMSFMMGAAFIVIGLLNLSSFLSLPKKVSPPLGLILTMMVYLACVIYAGYTFSADKQLYGGIVGMIAMTVALVLSFKKNDT